MQKCSAVYSTDFLPSISESRKNTMKIKNNTFAIPAALAAMPVNPNIPAIIATTRKIIVQRNIALYFKGDQYRYIADVSEIMPVNIRSSISV